MATEEYRERLSRLVPDLEADDPDSKDLIWDCEHESLRIDRDIIPAPGLMRLLLVGFLGIPAGYPGDKTRWVIPFRYKNIRCSLADEKMGLFLYMEKSPNRNKERLEDVTPMTEIVSRLQRASIEVEKLLQPLAEKQMQQGRVTIANRYHRLVDQYKFFRNQASELFVAANSTPERSGKLGNIDYAIQAINTRNRNLQEGSHNSIAMIDSYFSIMEHLLLFCLPFANYPVHSEDLTDFLKMSWTKRYKRIFPLDQVIVAQHYYEKLRDIREKYRNPMAHGGFDKRGASIYLHLPFGGLVPANITAYKDSIEYDFFPIGPNTFDDVCALFDSFDKWLRDEGMPAAIQYAESGLELPFDPKSCKELLTAAENLDNFHEWILGQSHLADMFYNADY